MRELLGYSEKYERFKPFHNQLCAIKWKSKREQFKAEHSSVLKQFSLARRKLPDVIHATEWQRKLDTLKRESDAAYAEYKALRTELTKLLDVKCCVDRALSAREGKGRDTRLFIDGR